MLFGTCGCFCCAKPEDFSFSAYVQFKQEITNSTSTDFLTGLIYILKKASDSNNPRVRFEKLDHSKKTDLLHGSKGDGQIFPLSEPTPVLDSIDLSKQGFTKCHVDKFGVCAEMQQLGLDDMGVVGPWAFDKHIGCYCCNCVDPKKVTTDLPDTQNYCPAGGTPSDPTPRAGGEILTTLSSTEKAKYRLIWIKAPKKQPTDKQYYILAIPIYMQSSSCKEPTGLIGGTINITFWKKNDYMDFNDELGMDSLPPRPCPYYYEKPAGTGDGLDYNKELEKLDIYIDVTLRNKEQTKLKILWAYEASDTRLKGNGWVDKNQFYWVTPNACPTGLNSPIPPCCSGTYMLPPQQEDPETGMYQERKYFERKYNLPLWWQQPGGKSWPMDTGLFMKDCNPAIRDQECYCCTEVYTLSGGSGTTTKTYTFPSAESSLEFNYSAFNVPDAFTVKFCGTTVVDTGKVSGNGKRCLQKPAGCQSVEVTVVGPEWTAWSYKIKCKCENPP